MSKSARIPWIAIFFALATCAWMPAARSQENVVRPISDGPTPLSAPEFVSIADDPVPIDTHHGFYRPGIYFRAEGLMMDREDENFTLSDAGRLGEFDHEFEFRATLGHRYDSLLGWEVTFAGPFQFTTGKETTGTGLDSLLTGTGVDLSAFDGAVVHRQLRASDLHSLEISRTFSAWEIVMSMFGIRYLNFTDEYRFVSIDPAPGSEVGHLTLDLDNHLLGGQAGLELLYPHNRWLLGGRVKAGAFVNFAEGHLQVTNAGVMELDNEEEQAQLAGVGELSLSLSHQLTPDVTIRAGYELWYLYGLAETTEQSFLSLSRNTLSELHTEGDAFLHGGSISIEIVK